MPLNNSLLLTSVCKSKRWKAPTKNKPIPLISEKNEKGSRSWFWQVEIATDKKTPVNYQLMLHNKASVPIEKVKIEYKIFYQQEEAVPMEVPEERQTERALLLAPHRPQNQLKIKEGRFKTLSLEAGETWEDDSPMITLLERKTLRRYQHISTSIANRWASGCGVLIAIPMAL